MRAEEEKPNYFRPDFNVPCTMRGIKSLSLGIKDAVDPLIEEAEEEADDLLNKEESPLLKDIEMDFERF